MQLMARGGGSGSVREDGAEGGAVAKEDERSWRREAEAVGDERSEWLQNNAVPTTPSFADAPMLLEEDEGRRSVHPCRWSSSPETGEKCCLRRR
nr:hypothetical protein Itr_chr07CG06860 [Ipomoea trifida]